MHTETNIPLAPYSSFKTGGAAERALFIDATTNITDTLATIDGPLHMIGFGSNMLVSDAGLPGTTLLMRGGHIEQIENTIVADAGVWWDDLVDYAISRNLWGIECTSAIPGSVGAAVVGNIAAYGQAVSDTLEWAEIYDTSSGALTRYAASELQLQYRASVTLQTNRSLIVVRAAFCLSDAPTKDLEYESALKFARENNYDVTTLSGRRSAIIDARQAAGSLWDYRDEMAEKTAGSFFRNPLVDAETAERIMSYDETGKSLELLKTMNRVHGGETSRVSAAHVLLAAGFVRGQEWFDGAVRLHPKHVLKIENAGGATSQQIYDVSRIIVQSVHDQLNVTLQPEIRMFGHFDEQ